MIRRSHSKTPLSLRQKNFAHNYVKNKGNVTRSYKEAYGTNDDNVAASSGFRLLRMDKIKTEIERILGEIDIDKVDEKTIASGIANMAFGSESEMIKTRNLELLARWKAMLTDKTINENHDYNETDFNKMREQAINEAIDSIKQVDTKVENV
jgi:hypothetical protein